MIDSLSRVIHTTLLHLRWLSVAVMVIAALASPLLLGPSALMAVLLAYATSIALVNLGLLWLVSSRVARAPSTTAVPWLLSPPAQLGLDLLAWGGYLFLSGGATNPLISLLLPLVAIGALILTPRQAWLLAGAAILIYSVLWAFHMPLHIADFSRAAPLHLFGMWLVFAVSAVLVVGFIVRLSDRIRRRDRELAAAREQAIRDDWLITLGSQAAAVAHALGTPLASLNVLADDLLDDGRLPPELTADVQAMKTQIRRCKETLSQLAARASQAAGGEAQAIAVGDWLRGLLLAWQGRHPAMAVAFDIGQALEKQVVPTDVALEQTLSNLLDNAVKAGASRIRVSAVDDGGMLAVRIKDNGSGMSAAALAAFAQRQPPSSAGGLGVGILLGRAAIERRGGSLEFQQPETGTGALALLRLPLTDGRRVGHGG
ncbi:MAG: sensor histidine kinase [Sphingobacteriia bacterium]|nr:sensor histidine kinase [Sphingobacteriia bacterium]NCC40320.1 sensor histidine kinase [Gammaproteobacteria bacterium]